MTNDIDDLIARLEFLDGTQSNVTNRDNTCREAAAALREQRSEIARLKKLNQEILDSDRAAEMEAIADAERAEAERDAAMKVIEAAKAMREVPHDPSFALSAFDAALAKLEQEQGK